MVVTSTRSGNAREKASSPPKTSADRVSRRTSPVRRQRTTRSQSVDLDAGIIHTKTQRRVVVPKRNTRVESVESNGRDARPSNDRKKRTTRADSVESTGSAAPIRKGKAKRLIRTTRAPSLEPGKSNGR